MSKFLLGFIVGVLVIPVVALVTAWLGLMPVNANSHPSHWESALAHFALDRASARRAPHLVNPIAPTEENLMAGVKMFKGDCAGCHGDPNTVNSSFVTDSLYPPPPRFAIDPPRKPDYELFWLVKGGVRYSGMFAWDGQGISDERLWTAVTFLTHLNSLPPAVDAEWHKKGN